MNFRFGIVGRPEPNGFGGAARREDRLGRVAMLGIAWLALAAAWPARAMAGDFDGERAMASVREQCAFGPRVPGTVAHAKERDWLTSRSRALGWHARLQSFATRLPLTGQTATGWNAWVTPRPDGPQAPALLLSAHWDTRPWADRDPSGANPPMLGANDGASGVAMALELARALADDPMRDRVALAFWDIEDAGTVDDPDSWGLGAQFAAANPPAWIGRVALGINLDMVGGQDLTLTREAASVQCAPGAIESIWQIGRVMAPGVFLDGDPIVMDDDHLPWIRAGLPFIDLIGFPYRYWHTAGDAPEHCSAEKMHRMGNALLRYIRGGRWQREGRALASPSPSSAR